MKETAGVLLVVRTAVRSLPNLSLQYELLQWIAVLYDSFGWCKSVMSNYTSRVGNEQRLAEFRLSYYLDEISGFFATC